MKKFSRSFTKLTAAAIVLLLFLNAQASLAFFSSVAYCQDDLLPRQRQHNEVLNDPELLYRDSSQNNPQVKLQKIDQSDIRARSTHANSSEKLTPEKMYTTAWAEVKRHFLDQTFNGQNWNYWKNKYKGKLLTVEDANKAIETMIYSLGDTNTFLSGKTTEPSVITGVGLKLGMRGGHSIFVLEPIESSPAAKAGIKRDWIITHVDGRSTKHYTLIQVVEQIRGTSGSSVELSFLDGTQKKTLTVQREQIAVPTVIKSCMLDSEIGYIRVNSIRETTCAELENELAKLTGAKGLILDLRDCDGCDFTAGMYVVDLFIQQNKCIAYVRFNNKNKPATKAYYSTKKLKYSNPMAILINRGTSGITELVAAALRDNGATTYGQYTNGNSVVQKEVKLSEDESVYTTAGIAISPVRLERLYRRGLNPDRRVAPVLLSGCGAINRGILANGPWYLFAAYHNYPYIPELYGLSLQLSFDGRELLFDCQLSRAFKALKKLEN